MAITFEKHDGVTFSSLMGSSGWKDTLCCGI